MKDLVSGSQWRYALYTVSHPLDAYYEIRHRNQGSVALAVFLVILFSLSISVNRISSAFIVNDTDPRTVDSLQMMIAVLLLYLLLCVGNWSVTCLMEGEGRLRDILIAVGYAVTPMIVCFFLGTLLSHAITADGAAFYHMLLAVGIAYSAFLLLTGIMTVHHYTLAKTLVTLALTLVAMLLIIFVVLLFFDLINQVISFFHSIYQELIFRS